MNALLATGKLRVNPANLNVEWDPDVAVSIVFFRRNDDRDRLWRGSWNWFPIPPRSHSIDMLGHIAEYAKDLHRKQPTVNWRAGFSFEIAVLTGPIPSVPDDRELLPRDPSAWTTFRVIPAEYPQIMQVFEDDDVLSADPVPRDTPGRPAEPVTGAQSADIAERAPTSQARDTKKKHFSLVQLVSLIPSLFRKKSPNTANGETGQPKHEHNNSPWAPVSLTKETPEPVSTGTETIEPIKPTTQPNPSPTRASAEERKPMNGQSQDQQPPLPPIRETPRPGKPNCCLKQKNRLVIYPQQGINTFVVALFPVGFTDQVANGTITKADAGNVEEFGLLESITWVNERAKQPGNYTVEVRAINIRDPKSDPSEPWVAEITIPAPVAPAVETPAPVPTLAPAPATPPVPRPMPAPTAETVRKIPEHEREKLAQCIRQWAGVIEQEERREVPISGNLSRASEALGIMKKEIADLRRRYNDPNIASSERIIADLEGRISELYKKSARIAQEQQSAAAKRAVPVVEKPNAPAAAPTPAVQPEPETRPAPVAKEAPTAPVTTPAQIVSEETIASTKTSKKSESSSNGPGWPLTIALIVIAVLIAMLPQLMMHSDNNKNGRAILPFLTSTDTNSPATNTPPPAAVATNTVATNMVATRVVAAEVEAPYPRMQNNGIIIGGNNNHDVKMRGITNSFNVTYNNTYIQTNAPVITPTHQCVDREVHARQWDVVLHPGESYTLEYGSSRKVACTATAVDPYLTVEAKGSDGQWQTVPRGSRNPGVEAYRYTLATNAPSNAQLSVTIAE